MEKTIFNGCWFIQQCYSVAHNGQIHYFLITYFQNNDLQKKFHGIKINTNKW